MEDFFWLIGIGLLVFIFVTLRNRFDKIDHNLTVLNRKLDDLKKIDKPIMESKPTPIVPIIPAIEKVIEVKTPIIPIIEEISPKIEVEKVAFSADAVATPKPIQPKPEPKPTFWESFKEKNPDLEKFIGENLINKIGILILVLGISYFVKYSIDKGWISEPARVGIGILAGVIVLGVAHKLRQKFAAFSSVFVAGAIAIFYFTIAIAFHDYHLFGQTVAFSIMVLITAFAALITISYNRLELAVLTLIGGFAVPFMVSTGEGNYVVLFSYILILNAGILAIAYFKKWNLVNILAFVFTILLYGGWLSQDISKPQPHYIGALAFAFMFYLLFTVINIINNLKNKGEFSNTQLTMLAANTFLFYGVGMTVLTPFHPEFKGLFTTFVAVLNLVYAWFLYKKFGLDKKAVYLLIGLTLTFVTLAIPIQFNGHYITLFWAGEAVLLFWLSQKSNVTSYKFGSIIVQILMLVSLIIDWNHFYSGTAFLQIIANPIFITGIVATTSLIIVYLLLKNEKESVYQFGFHFNPEKYAKLIFVVGIILAYFVGILEVAYQATDFFANSNAAISFPVVYHLFFTAILSYFFLKTKTGIGQLATSIFASANIFMFTFVFSKLAFAENSTFVETGIPQRIAFYMHYAMLILIIYFGFLFYKMYKENSISEFFKKPIFVWISAFFIIYICSSEVMLHALVLNDSQISAQEITKYMKDNNYPNTKLEINFARESLSYSKIENLRETITKTSFPILWGILAFVFLILGIKKPSKTIRIIALALLGLTIVKLFLYDISNVSETGKIIAFILLGVLVLIISFVYQKLKILVKDDVVTDKNNEKPNLDV